MRTPDLSIRPGLLRPQDTDRLGWAPTLECQRCGGFTDFRPPADMGKCTWLYVVEVARCGVCRAPATCIRFERDGPGMAARPMGGGEERRCGPPFAAPIAAAAAA